MATQKVIKKFWFPNSAIFHNSLNIIPRISPSYRKSSTKLFSFSLVTVTKIIAFILIASVVVELSSAAPLTKDQSSTEIPKNQKNPHRKKFGLKHLKNGGNEHITREQRKLFKGVNPKLWRNSCNYDNAENSSDNDRPVSMYQQNMKVEVGIIKEIFRSLKSINITELENWEEFYNSSFDFLPIKPKVSFCNPLCPEI